MSIGTDPRTPLTVADVNALIDATFPGIHVNGRWLHIESVADRVARVRMSAVASAIRPGGTISGPAMFTLADFAIYAALIATLGAPAIAAVTSNLNITFLLRPEAVDVMAHARIIRLGRRLAYADVELVSVGKPDVIAHATGSYALPRI
ncbi:MAG: PaaI family thioesterase [Hyphomicrobiaceae bacterium]